ncbi:hypothetical protein ABZ589_26990 [Streptomyces sp. NPDC013313]|uniref:hypothetical protein n=1 Tax=Streptomyces sp. NPDC013313 TaxID=3155603 RepID=UPI0033E152F2
MPVPSETAPDCDGLPLIGHAAARDLFRTAECTGLGRSGTDEIFDQWLDGFSDIAFYRNGDLPVQARQVNASDRRVPESLGNSRVGEARLEAVFLNPAQPAPAPESKQAEASSETEEADVTEEADETDEIDETDETDEADDETDTGCDGMPGLCWHCEDDKERYAKIDYSRGPEDEDDDPYVLQFVNTYPGGMGEDPSYGLGGELPPDLRTNSIEGLTVLTEAAQRKLDTERWEVEGPWRLDGFSCESDLVDPDGEDEEPDVSDDEPGWESDAIRYYAEIDDEDDVPVLQITGARWGELHIFYREPVSVPGDEPPDTGTVDGLRTVLRRATEQVGEAGHRMDGGWTLHWSRCYVLLAG